MPRAGWLALGAISGAFAGTTLAGPVAVATVALLALAVALLGVATRRAAVAALGVAAALVLCRALVGELTVPTAERLDALGGTGAADHSAVVLSLFAAGGGQQRAVIRLVPPEAPEHVYAWLPRYPALAPGDEIRFRGSLDTAPDVPGFGDFLARSGISFTTRARTMERIGATDSPLAALEQLRRAGGEALARALPEPQGGLAAAILIGLRDLVSRDVAESFRTSGLSHVVAISGWHISLLGGVVSGALRGLSRRPRSLLVLVAITTYAVLAGASPSVVRAALMAVVVLLARESGRKGQASAALGLAALGMLLVDPATVEDIGFQLSLTATAGLLCWAGPIAERLRPRLPQRTPGWMLEALAVSLAAQAATLPLVLLHFGRLSLVAPLANLLVAPIVAPVMLAATLALAAGALVTFGVPSLFVAPFTLLGSLALGSMIGIADVSASLPLASVELPPPLDVASAALAGACVVVALRRRKPATALPPAPALVRAQPAPKSRPGAHEPGSGTSTTRRLGRTLLAGGCTLAMVLVLVGAYRPDGRLHLTVLDVGQGDAILVQGPRGGRILVDTGPDPDRLLSLLDARIPPWDRRLDLVVITHPHEDHVAGLALLLDRYRIGGVGEPGMIGPGPGDRAFRQRMAELGRASRVLAAGDRLDLDGVSIDVHWPLPGRVPLRPIDSGKEINNVSLAQTLTASAVTGHLIARRRHRAWRALSFGVSAMAISEKTKATGLRATLEEAMAAGQSMQGLTVLAVQNDPYRVDTRAGHRDGEWLAMQAEALGDRRIHLRGLHYMVIGRVKPDGKPYTNTEEDWLWLQSKAAKAARWLGYIAFDRIIDNRNASPMVRIFEEPQPHPHLTTGLRFELPEAADLAPKAAITDFVGAQPYKLVLFGEKASLEDVLAPIAESRMADLYLPTGEASDTMIHQMARIGADDGRHMVIFYLSDCDPSGWQMAVSVSRKLQACRDLSYPDLSFEVRPIALTPDQVREYGLPSTPLKTEEKRADAWQAAMGVAQTEIDAIATLQPRLLDRLVRQAIKPYFDTTLAGRVAQARAAWLDEAQAVIDAQIGPEQLDLIHASAEVKLGELTELIEELNDALQVDEIEGVEFPEVIIPGAEVSGEPNGLPLIHSDWDYASASMRLIDHKAYRS
jgi:ComEC/Rec2-related protein